ncbi:MAG: signal peptidase I [Terriglobia bacterium]
MEPPTTPELNCESGSALSAEPAPAPTPPTPAPKHKSGAWETTRSLLVILVCVFGIRIFIGEATVIPTGSMEDTILIGDHVFLDKLPYGPRVPYTSVRLPELKTIRPGDIVAFPYPRNPSVMYVKRVIGVGGDVIRVVDEQVYRDGKKLNEPYAVNNRPGFDAWADDFPPPPGDIDEMAERWGADPDWARDLPKYVYPDGIHVPRGYLFVMGDNRDNSFDSRFWGFVPARSVVGEPLFVYWSYRAPSSEWMEESLEGRLRFDGSILKNFVRNTRWSRIGKIFENPN